jgi:hypothetical protein
MLNQAERVRFGSAIPGLKDAKRWALYDCVGYAAAATILGDSNFFTVPVGGAGVFNGAAVAKTLLQTNVKTQGQLAAGHEMAVWDIRVQADLNLFNSDTTTTILSNAMIAVRNLLMGSFMEIKIDGKDQLQISPIALLSAGYGPTASGYGGANVTAAGAAGAGALYLTNGTPNRSALWNLNPIPIVIRAGLTFSVVITTPIAVVLPANTAVNIWVHLDGVLHRTA